MKRRWSKGLAVVAVLVAVVAWWRARTPRTDAGRRARIERWSRAFAVAFPEVPDLSAADLLERLDRGDDVVLVDVRTPGERAVSTLPGAIDASTFMAHPQRYAGRVVVAYCTIGVRSARWAQVRRAEGHDVRNLRGSVLAWVHAGGGLVHGGAPTKRVHVYGPSMALTPRDHDPVW